MGKSKEERMLELFGEGALVLRRRKWAYALVVWLWRLRVAVVSGAKRVFDLAVGLILLAIASPVMLLVAIAIKLDSPGPILFKQTRVGKWGQTFTCLKFRSMFVDAERRKKELMALNEADGPVFKMKNDPRITRVGRVIRKLSLDELPQLINIIRGEMSLVGPRPPIPSEVEQYKYDQRRRLDATPGLTGLQQVSGRSNMNFERWVALDVEYIQKQSFWYDLKIILKTIPAVLFGRGAY